MRIVLRAAAEEDIRAARAFYETARPGLGSDLAQDLDRLFARLEAFPRSAPIVAGYEPVRRASLRRFPYAIFYHLSATDRIDVLRVLHTARSSGRWPASP